MATKQETQSKWTDRISRAKKVRKNWKDKFQVDLALEFYDGNQNPGYDENEWITINKIYSHIKTILPTLYKADPYFYIEVKRAFDPNPMNIALWETRADIRQSMLNYMKAELKLKLKTRLAIQDAQFSYGVIKTHHVADIQDNPDKGKPIRSDENDEILLGDEGEPILEPDVIPINERYILDRIHPDDFLWDENAGPLYDTWSWVAQRVITTLEKAQKDTRFKKSALKKVQGKGVTEDEELKEREIRKKGTNELEAEGKFAAFWDKDKVGTELFVYWEIYDLDNDQWLIIAEEGEVPLKDPEKVPNGIKKHPFSILRFTLRDMSPYPIPPVSQALSPQKEYNLSRSRLLTHRKRFNRKYEAVDGAVDEEELSKLESGEDGTIVKVKQFGAINPIKDAPLDQQGLIEISLLNTDILEMFGSGSDEARGIAGAESATQAGILDKRLDIKEGDAMSEVVEFVLDIAQNIDRQVQANIVGDEAIKTKGPQGAAWKLVREEDYQEINGDFSYDVNMGATVPRLPHIERQSWVAFLTLLQGFPQLLLSDEFMKEMAELHFIENDALVAQLIAIGKAMMSGKLPTPGNPGSVAGQGEARPVSAEGGAQSLNTPNPGQVTNLSTA